MVMEEAHHRERQRRERIGRRDSTEAMHVDHIRCQRPELALEIDDGKATLERGQHRGGGDWRGLHFIEEEGAHATLRELLCGIPYVPFCPPGGERELIDPSDLQATSHDTPLCSLSPGGT